MKKPLVSCICVTQNRRFFLRKAIAYFQRAADRFEQATNARAELVIVDGSKQSNAYLVEEDNDYITGSLPHSPVRYIWHPSPDHAKVGWFHNQACEASTGDFIIQWDDDDWHSASRILKQCDVLRASAVPAFTFTSKFYLYHLPDKVASLARTWHVGKNSGSVGAMFAYHRATWEKVPFQDVPQGEDNFFWSDCQAKGIPFLDSEDPSFCMYVRHHQNGSPLTHAVPDLRVTSLARAKLAEENDLAFYDEVTELLPLASWDRLRPMHGRNWERLARRAR